jgi:hypothetical protein
MARDYVRPGIGRKLLRELVPNNRRVLINPDWDDLSNALAALQKRCRKHTIPAPALRRLYDATAEEDFFIRSLEVADSCPWHFKYDLISTRVAAMRLGEGLTAFVLERTNTRPGDTVDPLIHGLTPDDVDFNAGDWLEATLLLVWPFLTDVDIEQMEGWAAAESMSRYVVERDKKRAQKREAARGSRRVAADRRRFMAALLPGCQGRLPQIVGELQERLAIIADEITAEGRSEIPWSEAKKRWPGLTMKFKDELIPRLDARNYLTVADMTAVERPSGLSISAGRWTGAQRQFRASQLVLRVNARGCFEELLRNDPTVRPLIDRWTSLNKGLGRVHPLTDWTVGWLRVHIGEGWVFIDEIQSDPLETFRQSAEMAPLVDAVSPNWHLHGAATIHRWAREMEFGFFMHSRESLLAKPGATKSQRKWKTYYHPVAKAFGLSSVPHPAFRTPILGDA